MHRGRGRRPLGAERLGHWPWLLVGQVDKLKAPREQAVMLCKRFSGKDPEASLASREGSETLLRKSYMGNVYGRARVVASVVVWQLPEAGFRPAVKYMTGKLSWFLPGGE